jgi:hypothetical protein
MDVSASSSEREELTAANRMFAKSPFLPAKMNLVETAPLPVCREPFVVQSPAQGRWHIDERLNKFQNGTVSFASCPTPPNALEN